MTNQASGGHSGEEVSQRVKESQRDEGDEIGEVGVPEDRYQTGQ